MKRLPGIIVGFAVAYALVVTGWGLVLPWLFVSLAIYWVVERRRAVRSRRARAQSCYPRHGFRIVEKGDAA